MDDKLNEKYGAFYFDGSKPHIFLSGDNDLYTYTAYSGGGSINVEHGDSVVNVVDGVAIWSDGPRNITFDNFAVVIRGYRCGTKTATLKQRVNLPYVNGCATRQIFPPERVGDPTFQQLTIPPYTSEQVHHIHPTARVVYVTHGRGFSIVGQSGNSVETELKPGMMIVLEPLCPHHFRTEDDSLTVLPFHVFSSGPGGLDNNHPMFNGTKEV